MPIQQFDKKDFSNANQPQVEQVSVLDWNSPQNQTKVEPDIILYVIAAHMQFLRTDRKYLKDFLKTQRDKYPNNRVIFALNLHHTENGECKATPQNICDVKEKVTEIHQKVYGEGTPLIVEIDARRGLGIAEITRLICQILPKEKLNNIEAVLNTELKEIAQQQRRDGFIRNTIEIASRIALFKVDYEVEDSKIILAAAKGIYSYSFCTFNPQKEAEYLTKAMELLTDEASRVEEKRSEDIISKEYTTKKEDVYETETRVEYHTETTTEDVVITDPRPGTLIQWELGPIKIGQGPRNVPRIETLTKTRKIPVPITESVKVGTRQVIDQEIEKVVGTKYLKGGYEALVVLLKIALGIENYCNQANGSLEECIKQQEQWLESKFQPLKPEIERLVDSNKDSKASENQLIQLLESALLN